MSEILCSTLIKPYSVDQGREIGRVIVPKEIKLDNEFYMEFWFAGTVIKVYVKDKNNNQISQITIKYETN